MSLLYNENFPAEAMETNNLRHAVEKKKHHIARKFSLASYSYNLAARLQRQVGSQLMQYLPREPSSILDMGCGTGFWTKALAECFPCADITGLDLAWGMLQEARKQITNESNKNIHWLCGDIDSLPFANDSFDLIYSNLSIQWCQSLHSVLTNVHKVLRPGGYFIFSTLAKESLIEIKKAWHAIGESHQGNKYMPFTRQKHIYDNSLFKVKRLDCQYKHLYYQTVSSALSEMKLLGITTLINPRNKGLTTPSRLNKFIASYEKMRDIKGIPCTYQVICGVLIR